MKTAQEVEKEINDIIKSIKKESTKVEVGRAKREVEFLRQIKRYLETEPREEFIKEEVITIQSRLENINRNFEAWKVGRSLTQYKDPYSAYLTACGVNGMKAQLKTLQFILS
jgi:predicted nuclease with TOPRIM domain